MSQRLIIRTTGQTGPTGPQGPDPAAVLADGEILTRVGGVSDGITRAALAADTAFSSRYGPLATARKSGITIHVDSTTGNDANAGTVSAPVRTISQAITLCGTKKFPRIHVTSTAAAPVREIVNVAYSGGSVLTIEPAIGLSRAWLAFAAVHTSGWTLVSGTVYTKALGGAASGYASTISQIFNESATPDAIGDRTFPRALTRNVATPTTPASGEYGWTRPTMWLNIGADPNGQEIEVPTLGSLQANTNSRIVLRSVTTLYANANNIEAGLDGAIECYDCESHYAQVSGFATRDNGVLLAYNCRAFRNVNDGFNVTGSGSMLADGVDGSYNGDEGISPHGTCSLVVRRSRFTYNVQSGLAAVDASVVDIEDCVAFANHRNGAIVNQGGFTFLNTVSGSIRNSSSIDHTGPGIHRSATSTVVIANVDSGTANGNAVADVLAGP